MRDDWLLAAHHPPIAGLCFTPAQRHQLQNAIRQAGFVYNPVGEEPPEWYVHPTAALEIMLHEDALHLISHEPRPHAQASALVAAWLRQFAFLMPDVRV